MLTISIIASLVSVAALLIAAFLGPKHSKPPADSLRSAETATGPMSSVATEAAQALAEVLQRLSQNERFLQDISGEVALSSRRIDELLALSLAQSGAGAATGARLPVPTSVVGGRSPGATRSRDQRQFREQNFLHFPSQVGGLENIAKFSANAAVLSMNSDEVPALRQKSRAMHPGRLVAAA